MTYLRILMTADTVGGVWTYALELARALHPRGVQVVLATMGAPATYAQRREAAAVPGLELRESRYRLEWMDDPWDDVARAGDWLLALEQELAPDVIHLNGYAHAALPWRSAPLVCAHSCVLSWWRAVHGGDAPASWDRYREAVTRGIHAAGVVVAPTYTMGDAIATHYGPPAGARVIPNARAAAEFPPGRKEPFILSAGRLWDDAKNVTALDAAAPGLPWPIYVAGPREAPAGTRRDFRAARPLGQLAAPALAGLLGRASIYAHPARYEPFGLAVLEAALTGCALVLGDIPALRELWGDCAWFVPPDDQHALRHAMLALIDDPVGRRALAARSHARALALTPERMAEGYLAAYAALGGPHRMEGRCAS